MDCGRRFDRRFYICNLDKIINTFVQSRIERRAAEAVSVVVAGENNFSSVIFPQSPLLYSHFG